MSTPVDRKRIEDDLAHANRVIKEVGKESDRAAIILLGAEFDHAMLRFLEEFLLPPTQKSSDIFSFEGALGTFSSRIELMYRLALIPAPWHHDLQVFRKIRNDFAHGGVGLDFQNESIAARIRNLKIVESIRQDQIKKVGIEKISGGENFCTDPRSRLILFSGYMLTNLTMMRINIRGPLQWANPFSAEKK